MESVFWIGIQPLNNFTMLGYIVKKLILLLTINRFVTFIFREWNQNQ